MVQMSQPERSRPAPGSPWSFRIFTVSGIPVRLHFTFLLFLVWIVLLGRAQGAPLMAVFLLLLFGCVLLHELGHALTAKRLGIGTRDIVLYPIGGVAMLTERAKPRQELLITLAGPAVNVVIALVLGIVIFATTRELPSLSFRLQNQSMMEALFAANVALALFNMIPAFPMDGGRVLRSLLAMRMTEHRATQIAAGVGQFLAIVFGLVAIFTGNLMLMLVAFFVFLGASQEVSASTGLNLLAGKRVREAMMTKFQIVESGWTLDSAAKLLLEGSQQDFPVVIGDSVLGVLTRSDIAMGLSREGPQAYVAGAMRREFKQADPEDLLEAVLSKFSGDPSPILVMQGERLVGMVTSENLSEFIMLEQARRVRGGAPS